MASDYEVDPFSLAERDQLLAKARDDGCPMLQFWFNTGLRPGDLMAQRWPKVSLVERLANAAHAERGRFQHVCYQVITATLRQAKYHLT